MRSFLASAVVVILFSSCRHESVKPTTDWGVSSVGMDKATLATGSIDMQNNGPKVTYDAVAGYVSRVSGTNLFKVTFKFTSTDSLMVIVAKKTSDYNYHFHAADTENQLLYVIFDRDTLELTESAIAIQPQPDSNSLSTVTNIHTTDHGDFNGTIDQVVLILP